MAPINHVLFNDKWYKLDPRVNVVVGKNGSGKSSFIQAVVEQSEGTNVYVYKRKEAFREFKHLLDSEYSSNEENGINQLAIMKEVVKRYGSKEVILIDDIELYLHLTDQLTLIENILDWGSNYTQLICSTNAPGIISQGWKDKVISLDGC